MIWPPSYPIEVSKGQILFFKKPSKFLTLDITTDKEVYAPGDTVNFQVQIIDISTGRVVTDRNSYVSIFVTDNTVFNQIEQKLEPPSLPAQVYLEYEVMRHDS
jgi:uncharacterized protein YfaS (alpha-2-macroglobulin family)